MAVISSTFRNRFLSGDYVGPATPVQKVRVRRGWFQRKFATWTGGDVGAVMPGMSASKPWQAFWTPEEAYRELPGVLEVSYEWDFEQKGIKSATITIDNLVFKDAIGVAGLFRQIKRGYLAPFRGYPAPGRNPQTAASEWLLTMVRAVQITIQQGFADELPQTFTGLIDDVDLDDNPDQIVITARSFGAVLTDQHLFGWAKDRELARRPTVFADRLYADEETFQGGGAEASSISSGHPANYVVDDANTTYWASRNRGSADVTEWVQIRVPRGRYESVQLFPAYSGMACFISVYARSDGIDSVKVDGVEVGDGWVALGNGDVPGDGGGVPWVKSIGDCALRDREYALGHTLEVGDDTVFRFHFRELRRIRVGGDYVYRAGVRRAQAISRRRRPEAVKQRWILVDDAADVVKVILRWAGFKQWIVESTGVRLKDKMVFHQGDFLVDPIQKIAEMTGYVFFIADPSAASGFDPGDSIGEGPGSIGVPVFRQSRVLHKLAVVEEVREDRMLTGVQVKHQKEPLAYIIRVRGRVVKRGEEGTALGEDPTKRFQAEYRPPWTKGKRSALLKHVVHTDKLLNSEFECGVACRLIAIAEALRANTGVFECPGLPSLGLDDHASLIDTATGADTRMWIAQISSRFTSGKSTSWEMTVGGALLDTPDVVEALADYREYVDPGEADVEIPYAIGGVVQ